MLAMAGGVKNIIVTDQGKPVGEVKHSDIFNAVQIAET